MNSCNCAVAEVVNIPGNVGPAGYDGTNGQPAFTALAVAATFVDTATPVVITVINSTWMAVNQVLFLSDGTNFATVTVTAVSSAAPTVATVLWLNYYGDGATPVTVGIGAMVVCSGRINPVTPITVPNGGTGAATLTGVLLGNGTGAVTTIPMVKGTFVANGATGVNVANAAITASSMIIITLNTPGGTVGAIPAVQTITAGTGFSVKGTASDTSTYNYIALY